MNVIRQSISRHIINRATIVFSGLTIFGFLLSGCAAVGPDYVPPEVSAPKEWSTSLAGGLSVEAMDPIKMTNWWTTLNDPALTSLIDRAVAGNLDLYRAMARVREARARRGIRQADRFPTIGATGSANVARSSEETGSGTERDLYAAGFDAGWELDVFGRVRRSVEAAEAALEASKEGLHDVMVSLLAEVALNYVEVRSFQTRLSIAEANQKAQEETYGCAKQS